MNNSEIIRLIKIVEARNNDKVRQNKINDIQKNVNASSPGIVKFFIEGKSIDEQNICKQMDIGDVDFLIYPSGINVQEESLENHPQFPCHFYIIGQKVRWRLRKSRPLIHCAFLSTSLLNDLPRELFGATGMIFQKLADVVPALTSPVRMRQNSTKSDTATVGNVLWAEKLDTNLDFDNSSYFDDCQESKQQYNSEVSNTSTHMTSDCPVEAETGSSKNNFESLSSQGLNIPTENDDSHREDCFIIYSMPPSNKLTFQAAFSCDGWPRMALSWYSRERKWPGQHIIQQIVGNGFHIIAKSPPQSYDLNKDFCFLFATAELSLSSEMTMSQRKCYTAMKMIQESVLYTRKYALRPYHLKTVLFWVSEQATASFWVHDNIENGIKACFKYLMTSLQSGFLPHYFIPEFNLISYIDRKSMEMLYIKTREVFKNPSLAMKRHAFAKLGEKSSSVKSFNNGRMSSTNDVMPDRSIEAQPVHMNNYGTEAPQSSLHTRHHPGVCQSCEHSHTMCPVEDFWKQATESGIQSEKGEFANFYNEVTEEIMDVLFNRNSDMPAAGDLQELLTILQTWQICHNFSVNDFKLTFKHCFQTVYTLSALDIKADLRQQVTKGLIATVKLCDNLFVNHKEELLAHGVDSVINRLQREGGSVELYRPLLESINLRNIDSAACVLL